MSFGIIGAFVYRSNVSVLILDNMFIWPGDLYVIIVSIIKIVNLWASYAIYASNVCDIFDGSFGIKHNNFGKKYLIRFMMLTFTIFVAYSCRYYLALMTALTSSFDSAVGPALLLPLIVYIGMFYHKMSTKSKTFHILLLIIALSVATFVVYSSIQGLLM